MGDKHREWLLLFAIKCGAAVCVVYVLYSYMFSLFTEDAWPPKNETQEAAIIAQYKKKLAIGDNPLAPRKPEEIPVFYQRIIDFDVKKGDLKSARDYTAKAIAQRIDQQIESLTRSPGTRTLITVVRNGTQKRDALEKLIAKYEQRPANTANAETKEQFEMDWKDAVQHFTTIPFDAANCPEIAEEIARLYQAKVVAAKEDPRMKTVLVDIAQSCLPKK